MIPLFQIFSSNLAMNLLLRILVHYFLGVKVLYLNERIFLTYQKYTHDLLAKMEMLESNVIGAP